MASFFERFRLFLWGLAAGVIALYVFGLVLGAYGPLELGLLSVICLVLVVLFAIHEMRMRRNLRDKKTSDESDHERHSARERRGF